MQSNSKIILIVCICLVVIGISAAVQIDYYGSKDVDDQPITTGSDQNQEHELIDRSFYSGSSTPRTVRPAVSGLTARAFLVGDIESDKIILQQDSARPLPVASMSKLVTAFVATDLMKRDSTVTITADAIKAPPDASNLIVGEKFSLDQLLLPLLLNSSNVAAESIASTTNRVRFLEMMSSYAWEIGMPQSFFADPSGVNPHNAASGKDLFQLAKYLVNYRPDILAVTRIPEADTATTSDHAGHHFTSTHPFVRDSRFIGGKTGRTPEAGETMMTILDMHGRKIVFVVLGSDYGYRESDTRILIREYEKKVVTQPASY